MILELKDLESIAQQDFDLTLFDVLAAQAPQYQNATPGKILNLLEEVSESYAALAPTLALTRQASAEIKIEFFTLSCQKAAKKLHSTQSNPQQLQDNFQMLSCCA